MGGNLMMVKQALDFSGDFRIATVQYSDGYVARIRRKDGSQINVRGEPHAAIGTKLCPSERAAIEEARTIIARGNLK